MSTATATCERKLKTTSKKLTAAEEENAELKTKLAESRKRSRTLARQLAERGAGDEQPGRQLAEVLEQQAATSEILRVISNSPSDQQPVFDAIAQSGHRLFGGSNVSVSILRDDLLHLVAFAGSPVLGEALQRLYPTQVDARFPAPYMVIREHKVLHVTDTVGPESPGKMSDVSRSGGHRSLMAVPMLLDNTALGAIFVTSPEPGGYREKQLDLLKTFADQAVIAIENARLFSKLQETIQHQAATSDVLRIVSSSVSDPQPVYDAIQSSVVRLFNGFDAAIWMATDDSVVPVAPSHRLVARPRPLSRENPPGACVLDAKAFWYDDIATDPKMPEAIRNEMLSVGRKSTAGVPLIRQGKAIGAITIASAATTKFSDKQITLLQTFADQAVIAIENARLFNELEARNKDLAETLEQQTATAEILRVISSSPGETQPVFDAIATAALPLFGGFDVNISLVQGESVATVALAGDRYAYKNREVFLALRPLNREGLATRAIVDCKVVHVSDIETDPDITEVARARQTAIGNRAVLVAPLIRQGLGIGSISVARAQPTVFSEKQVELLQTFADQAVIAIENARLFKDLEARNKDLAETLEQQTATAEILRVISRSQTDLLPVFEAIARSAQQLFNGLDVSVRLVEGNVVREVAQAGTKRGLTRDVPLRADSVAGRAILEGKFQYVPDVKNSPTMSEWQQQDFLERGIHAILSVPLLRDGRAIGVIAVTCLNPTQFTDKQIGVLQTFADQAVIAIENTRLFNETRESLERQTATAEILRVISSSPTDMQPVFEEIASSAQRLLHGSESAVWLVRGNRVEPVVGKRARSGLGGFPLDRALMAGRMVLDRKISAIPDVENATDLQEETREFLRRSGQRANLAVPLLKEDESLGFVAVNWDEPTAIEDKHIDLLKTFADQAVIAIENVRLFKELEARNKELDESLKYQTATGEVLRIVSGSVADAKPVFDSILASVLRLFEGFDASLWLVRGDQLVPVVFGGPTISAMPPPQPLNSGFMQGQSIVERRAVYVLDVETDPNVSEAQRQRHRISNRRTVVGVPLMREGKAFGSIGVSRMVPTPVSDKQLALLQTFADQAVIAIENARLFNELEARNKDLAETLKQQTATAEVLNVISSSVADTQPVFDAIHKSMLNLFEGFDGGVWLTQDDGIVAMAGGGPNSETEKIKGLKIPLDKRFFMGRTALGGETIRICDIQSEPGISEAARSAALQVGRRCLLSVPLIKGDKPIGALTISRPEPSLFTDKQLALLRTFADQAVIAIENARLFNELQSSLENQTATAEMLRAISRASFDLPSLLKGLTETAARLCDANRCNIFRPDTEGNYRPFVQYGYDEVPEVLELLQREPLRISRESAAGRAVLEKRTIHIPDISADTEFRRNDVMRILKFATLLAVPMLRDGEPIGVITMARGPEPRPFNEAHIKLVATFADQAVIAIENVRLINEIQEKSAQLEIANRHKSEFLASMSHELRTPLNAIIGFSEVLSEKMFGEVNDKQMQYLKTINASGQHLLSLINDILDLAKIEAGRMDLDLTTFNVAAALDNAMTLIRERAGRQSVALKLKCDAELKDWTADERKFKQVMLNLLSNAVKFTPQGGKITVAAKRKGDAIEVSVTDTGVGIAPEDQAAVFEEFKQVGGDRLRKAEGTGLGLSLTRKFVELHGGQIGLASEPGKGSTFYFTLPESKPEAA